MTARIAGLIFFFLVQTLAGAAVARERIAVFVVVAEDPELSENLTEVTIAKLAGARDVELVGMRELDANLKEIPAVRERGLSACLEEPACLAEVGVRASAGRAVIGSVRRDGPSFELDLALVHTKTSLAEGRTRTEVPADLSRLIDGVQAAAMELIHPADTESLGATPVRFTSVPVVPAKEEATRAGSSDALRRQDEREPAKTPWKTYVGFGAAGLAVVAFSAAVITASMASEPPQGTTRQEALDDLERKKDYTTAANVSLAVGGVFSAVAVVSFAWP